MSGLDKEFFMPFGDFGAVKAKLVATATLVVTLLRLTFAFERWGKK
jgi:hypothetical protein